ncbi:MAG TPA: D-glycero-beta-D-manno-heptose 1-phosphate adenylyltransferase [Chloroflexota bacterium]|nr:D-glycero-beta-D-manno-heptose 1-phosphate adenylyltransferase [Chloroflexota bacterium]
MPSPVDVVRNFRHLHALVIGDAMLDSYLEGTAARLCTEGPVPVVRKTAEERAPGGAANVAVNLRALGATVTFVGFVGADLPGMMLRQALRAHDVDDSRLVEDESVATLHKLRILADDQYVVRFDAGDTATPSSEAQTRLLAAVDAALPACDLIVLSDYRYGVVTPALLDLLRSTRAHVNRPLIVDSKDLHRVAAAGATIITPNHLEARLAIEPAAHADGLIALDEMERIGRRLLEVVETEYAAITLAAEGVLLLGRDGEVVHVPAHPVAHANDIGAGDSFTAALALGLGGGASAADAVRIGVDAAGIAVTKPRTASVQHQELLQRVSRDQQEPPTAASLAATLAARGGQTVVFTNGVFDILHAGHVHFLREAKKLGDILVVGVNSDRSARALKGQNRPINSERDRLALVAALDPVDHVLLFDEPTPESVIRTLRPDIHVKGGDYADVHLPEAEAVAAVGGRVMIIPLMESLSTSSVIERIVALAREGGIGVPA